MANVCEPVGLSVYLKEKLESSFSDLVWEILHYLQNIILVIYYQRLIFTTQVCGNVLWLKQGDFWGPPKNRHWCSGKGCKTISKEIRLYHTPLSGTVYKRRQFNTIVILSWSGWATKITPKSQGCNILGILKNSGIRSKAKSLSCIGECQCSWPHYQKYWTTTLAGLQGERHFSPKRTLLPIYCLWKTTKISWNFMGRMFCRLMRS